MHNVCVLCLKSFTQPLTLNVRPSPCIRRDVGANTFRPRRDTGGVPCVWLRSPGTATIGSASAGSVSPFSCLSNSSSSFIVRNFISGSGSGFFGSSRGLTPRATALGAAALATALGAAVLTAASGVAVFRATILGAGAGAGARRVETGTAAGCVHSARSRSKSSRDITDAIS